MPNINYETTIEVRATLPCITIELVHLSSDPMQEMEFEMPWYVLSKSLIPKGPRSQLWVSSGNSQQMFDSGATILFPARLPFRIAQQTAHEDRRIRCCISEERFLAETGLDGAWDARNLTACLDIRDPVIDTALLRLSHELRSPGFGSERLLDSICTFMLIYMARKLKHDEIYEKLPAGGLAAWQVNRIASHIAELDGQPPRMRDLARMCGISAGHLSRAFKQSTGRTLREYIENALIKRAQGLLVDGGLSAKEISWKLGYASPSSFSVAFKRACGESPSRYRLRHSSVRT